MFLEGDILHNEQGIGDLWVVEKRGDELFVVLYFNGREQHKESLNYIENVAVGFRKVGEYKESSETEGDDNV